MSAYLAPTFGVGAQFFNNTGAVLAGGFLYTYVAGTTTALATWTDSTQATPNSNPIVLNSAGRLSNEVWLQGGQTYKFILKDSSGNTIGTWDNVPGLNDANYNGFSEWVASGLTPTYVSATSFSIPGNVVSTWQVNRRVQYFLGTGTFYGTITSSSYSGATGATTVVVSPDSTSIDSTIFAVSYGFMSATNSSLPVGVYVASTNGVVAGLTGTGTINFSGAGAVTVPTVSQSDNSNNAASTAYVTLKAFNTALPAQSASTKGQVPKSDGSNASWQPSIGDFVYAYYTFGGF